MTNELMLALGRLDEFRHKLRAPQKAQSAITDGGIEFNRCDLERLRRDCARKSASVFEKLLCAEVVDAFNAADLAECDRYDRDLIELKRLKTEAEIESIVDSVCAQFKHDSNHEFVVIEISYEKGRADGLLVENHRVVSSGHATAREAVAAMFSTNENGGARNMAIAVRKK